MREEFPLRFCPGDPRPLLVGATVCVESFRSERARGCCFWGSRSGADRAPEKKRLWFLKPVSVGSFREPSLTTASIPGVSQQKPLLNPFPPADVAAVHRRRQRALSPAQTPEQTPLYRASSSMPILRSLGGSAVSCSSLRAASGAARGCPRCRSFP